MNKITSLITLLNCRICKFYIVEEEESSAFTDTLLRLGGLLNAICGSLLK